MYCTNCGAKNSNLSKFCQKCGHPLSNAMIVDKTEPVRKKSGKMYIILTALVLVVTIVVVSVFDLWPWSFKSDEKIADSNTGKTDRVISDSDITTIKNFSLDAIADECPECQEALDSYIQLISVAQNWTASKEDMNAVLNQLSSYMQHSCTAETIYVEDIPYSYDGGYGVYTGSWKGAGPSGKGTYFGTTYGNIVSYDGDWEFGLPNGEGVLYEENYLRDWCRTYTGEMRNGKRNGIGSWIEYHEDVESLNLHPAYRIYDVAEYRDDCLAETIHCVEYDAKTGDIRKYFQAGTDEDGYPLMGATWDADELSPEEVNALGVTGSLFIAGSMIYLGNEMVQSFTDPHYADSIYKGQTREEQLAELNQYQQKKNQEYQEQLEADKIAADKAWANDMLDRYENGEIDAYENDINYWNSIVYQ